VFCIGEPESILECAIGERQEDLHAEIWGVALGETWGRRERLVSRERQRKHPNSL